MDIKLANALVQNLLMPPPSGLSMEEIDDQMEDVGQSQTDTAVPFAREYWFWGVKVMYTPTSKLVRQDFIRQCFVQHIVDKFNEFGVPLMKNFQWGQLALLLAKHNLMMDNYP